MYPRAIGKLKGWLQLQEKEEEPRRAARGLEPEVIVHYWDGSAPEGRHVRDISESGAYIYTPERWYPGTIIRIILQGYGTSVHEDGTTGPTSSICIPARVVRQGSDGIAVEFVFRDEEEAQTFRTFLAAIPSQPARTERPKEISHQKGQALVEFALIIPLVLLLAVNAVNFGGFLFAWITVANASREGVQYMTMSAASPGKPTPATLAQVTALITTDVASLLNRASVVVAICTNTNGTVVGTGCAALADPEPGATPVYTLATVDVTYTYNPFIPLFSFPRLGISATLPSSTIHRKAVMRMLQ